MHWIAFGIAILVALVLIASHARVRRTAYITTVGIAVAAVLILEALVRLDTLSSGGAGAAMSIVTIGLIVYLTTMRPRSHDGSV